LIYLFILFTKIKKNLKYLPEPAVPRGPNTHIRFSTVLRADNGPRQLRAPPHASSNLKFEVTHKSYLSLTISLLAPPHSQTSVSHSSTPVSGHRSSNGDLFTLHKCEDLSPVPPLCLAVPPFRRHGPHRRR
jgi:hypothetical protein